MIRQTLSCNNLSMGGLATMLILDIKWILGANFGEDAKYMFKNAYIKK